jgi:hypothetical protein
VNTLWIQTGQVEQSLAADSRERLAVREPYWLRAAEGCRSATHLVVGCDCSKSLAHTRPMPQPNKPSIVAVVTIAVVSFLVSVVLSPADPLWFLCHWFALCLVSLGSYFAGYKRGCQPAVAEQSGRRADRSARPPHHVACGSALRGSTERSTLDPE